MKRAISIAALAGLLSISPPTVAKATPTELANDFFLVLVEGNESIIQARSAMSVDEPFEYDFRLLEIAERAYSANEDGDTIVELSDSTGNRIARYTIDPIRVRPAGLQDLSSDTRRADLSFT